jgi:hypothetical protein
MMLFMHYKCPVLCFRASIKPEGLEKDTYKPIRPTGPTGRLLIRFLKKQFKGIMPDIVIEDDLMELDA